MKENSHDTVPATPGSILKAKRQENGWSEREIAKALRMSADQVRAIEADDTEQLHGITYIRGYWVNYAKLMGINIDDAIEYHKTRLLDPPSLMSNPKIHTAPSSNEKKKKHAAWFFGLLALVGVVVLYLFQPQRDVATSTRLFESTRANVNEETDALQQETVMQATQSTPEVTQSTVQSNAADLGVQNSDANESANANVLQQKDVQQQSEQNASEMFSSSQEISQNNEIETAQLNEQALQAQKELPQQPLETENPQTQPITSDADALDNAAEPENVLPASKDDTLQVNSQTQSEPANAGGNVVNEAENTDEDTAAITPSFSTAEIAARTSAQSPDTVVFYNTQTSWFDVRDGRGNILYYDDVAANQVLRLNGQPPFYVYSTNANSLTIAYLGKVFAHQSQITDNSIRLKISQ